MALAAHGHLGEVRYHDHLVRFCQTGQHGSPRNCDRAAYAGIDLVEHARVARVGLAQHDFAREHPYVYFSINGDGEDSAQDMVWQVFSVFYTTTDFDYIRINKEFRDPSQGEITDAQLMNIITEARDRSAHDYDVTVSGTDKILTLSTCSYKYGRRKDVRFVVMAKLLEEDAPLQASASQVVNADKKTVE